MANLLTAIRLLLVIPVAWSMADPAFMPALLLAVMLIVAIASDYFDGKVARALNTASPNGQLFDHGTDFLFVTSGLAGATFTGLISPFLPILIVLAFSQYVLDSYYLFHEKQLRMSYLGRWNGVFYFVPLVVICLSRLSPANLSGILESVASGIGILLIASTVLSIADRTMAPMRRG